MEIRKAEECDFPGIWAIFQAVVQKGDTYVFDPDCDENDARSVWTGDGVATYVALAEGCIVGTYILKANQPGLGDHVANAALMVSPERKRQGTGRAMGEHAIEEARKAGFRAVQFNFVVRTNVGAVKLWESLGFEIVGTLPEVFRHRELGFVDACVMYRKL